MSSENKPIHLVYLKRNWQKLVKLKQVEKAMNLLQEIWKGCSMIQVKTAQTTLLYDQSGNKIKPKKTKRKGKLR